MQPNKNMCIYEFSNSYKLFKWTAWCSQRIRITEVYCISLIRDPESTEEQIIHVNRQTKHLKDECPRKFRAV